MTKHTIVQSCTEPNREAMQSDTALTLPQQGRTCFNSLQSGKGIRKLNHNVSV